MKLVTIVGARPQFVKAAVVSREIQNYNRADFGKRIEEVIVHTGQHYDANMSEVFFREMQIPKPQYFLSINSLPHGAMTGQMIEKIEQLLISESPDYVLVYGDTNSTLSGALAAAKLHIPIAHVESGLRSYNRKMPEEINRLLTDNISRVLFCPTRQSVENLKNEGIVNNQIHRVIQTGDVMYDAVLFYNEYMKQPEFDIGGNFVLSTIHRAENTDSNSRIRSIADALKQISADIEVLLPIHPRTKQIFKKLRLDLGKVRIVDPVSYHEMIYLLNHCRIVLTDSGGLQKEAYFFKKPCVTLRDETEWIELVDHEFNCIAGASKLRICEAFDKMIKKKINATGLYGDGNAGAKIVKSLLEG